MKSYFIATFPSREDHIYCGAAYPQLSPDIQYIQYHQPICYPNKLYNICLSILATRTSLFSYSFSRSINDSTDSLTWLFLRFSKAASFTSFKIIPSQKASITRARICEYLLSQLNSAHISFSLVILTFSWLPHGCQIAYMISILITLTK